MSEIDQIFATKGKANVVDSLPSISSTSSKHSKKKRKHETNLPQLVVSRDDPSNSKKRPEPETILDPSSDVRPKRPRVDRTLNVPKSKRSTGNDEVATFKDSRGSKARRTTEEGWLVYKEEELGIREDGGDTPFCPFDCDCCF